jgi:hypothetical protein
VLWDRYEQNPNSRQECNGLTAGTDACLQTYYRDFFPGQPFTDTEPCTGAASRGVEPDRAAYLLLFIAMLSWSIQSIQYLCDSPSY